MLARSHALSAAAGWLTTAAVSSVAGAPWPVRTIAVGAVVSAGAALLPDVDCPGAHAARALGPPGQAIARGMAALSRTVYRRTATARDVSDRYRDGHRGITHTLIFALVVGLVVAVLGVTPAATVTAGVVMWLNATWAARGILPWRARRIRVSGFRIEWAPVAGLVATLLLLYTTPPAGSWVWLGLPVGAGAILHDLGDAPAHHPDYPPHTGGIPLLWPVPVRGRRWYRCRPPAGLMFPVGGRRERYYAAGFAVASATAAVVTVWPAAAVWNVVAYLTT